MKKKALFLIALILCLSLLYLEVRYLHAADAWYNSSWSHRKKWTVQFANMDGDLTHYPLLIKRVDSDIDDYAQAGGDDLRFTKSDGTSLLDENEISYSEGGGNATLIYRVSDAGWTLDSDGAPAATYGYVYFGNGAAADRETAGVYDANYAEVWHTHDDPDTSTITGTINSIAGNKLAANEPIEIAGKIYKAQHFDGGTGDDDEIDCGSDANIDGLFDGGGTISMWVYMEGDGEGNQGWPAEKVKWRIWHQLNDLRYQHDFDGTNGSWRTNNDFTDGPTWYKIAIAYNNSAVGNDPALYLDGVDAMTTEIATPVGTRESDSASSLIVGNDAAGNKTWDGYIEEVMMSNTIRTAAWEKFAYYNENEADFELTWGSLEAQPSGFIPKVIIYHAAMPLMVLFFGMAAYRKRGE